MMSEQDNTFKKQWAIVELFGHTKLAGEVSEAAIGGCNFVRVDVPEVGEHAAYSKFLGQGAIYAITPVSREIAIRTAERLRASPVRSYDILPPRQGQLALAAGGGSDELEDAYDDE